MNMKKRMLSIVLSGAMAVSTAVSAGSFSAFAVAQCVAYSGSNVNAQDYVQWSDTVKSYLTVCDNGNYMRVQSGAIEGKLLVEYYSPDFEPLSTKLIDNELPIFGAFYDSGNNYYVLSGQENPKQNDSLEVFRITKYDKNWNKIKSCGLYGANTTVPFDAGSARMTHSGDHLLVRTCHEMYKSSDGNNHQSNVTIEVDMPSMTITDSYTGVMNVDYGYVSHSFNQFIKTDGNHIVALDHGDAHPRSAVLVKYNSDFTTGKFFPSYFDKVSNIDVVTYPEYTAGHYNYTGAAIGGFDVSSSSYIVAQSTVDLDYINTSETRNVYVSAVSKDLSTNKLNKITSYAEGTAYTELDKAEKAAKALNKDDYEDFSEVEKALAAIDRTKNITEQADVDAMVKAINDAVANLVKKAPASSQPDSVSSSDASSDTSSSASDSSASDSSSSDSKATDSKSDSSSKAASNASNTNPSTGVAGGAFALALLSGAAVVMAKKKK